MLQTGLFAISWHNAIMLFVGLLLIYLAISKEMEPLLLGPIGFAVLLANLPLTGLTAESGLLYILYQELISTGIIPLIIFLGIGTMTDFSPLLANPKTFMLGAAAQVGIFLALGLSLALGFDMEAAASIGIIGGADGPTAIYAATQLVGNRPEIIGAVTVSAYSYMALVPIIQPPIIKLLTTKKQRSVRMGKMREVSNLEEILFPIGVTVIVGLIVPSALPLVGMLMLGNLFQTSGVMDRLSETGGNALMNIATILLGLGVGFLMRGEVFLTLDTLKILLLGVFAFATATAGGTLLGQLYYKLSGGKINPMIGAAGVSAVPMASRVVQKEGQKADAESHLLMHAMGPNVAGVIGSATAAGVLIGLLA
ncbi:MAG: sodium ion-translocating decarboxylase subunit beta [Candidatus Acetothermia bacterium]